MPEFQGRSGPSNPISRSMHENCLRDTFLIILHIIYIHRSKLLPLQCNLHITTWQQAPSPILSLPTSSNIEQSEIKTLNQSVNNLHSHLLQYYSFYGDFFIALKQKSKMQDSVWFQWFWLLKECSFFLHIAKACGWTRLILNPTKSHCKKNRI